MLEPQPDARSAAADSLPAFAFDLSYAALPERFFSRVAPTPVADPQLIKLNHALAADLGLETARASAQAWAAVFSGNALPRGADPIAMVYAGHQFGGFVPQLGDGRAILLGEVRDRGGVRRDIQLKGAGRTPYSRGGDGRAALGPVLREYIVSEAMHALGIATTRSLAAVKTGETVFRERPLPGAIVTRVASSHVRVGTFQYFAARGDLEAVKDLADYVIGRHYRELESAEHRYLELLRAVVLRQAQLVADWMRVGFIHGVMNTDNMTICGETIDFGPCAFMDGYDPATVFSSIDSMGRYAYANQPPAAQWNLARFAETLLPLIDSDRDRAVAAASEVIDGFSQHFEEHWLRAMRAKLGLLTAEPDDLAFVRDWLEVMRRNACDFTLTFRRLCHAVPAAGADPDARARATAELRASFQHPDDYDAWAARWTTRLAREGGFADPRGVAMRRANPAYIPRNHRIEAVIRAASDEANCAPFEELLAVLSQPYEERPAFESYAAPPRPAERVLQTFCGT